jgi:hypothetical protein
MNLDKNILFEQYIKQKKSISDISTKFNRSRQTIYRLLKKYNIKIRTKSEARLLALNSDKLTHLTKRSVNENFFDEYNFSPSMFWILGLLYADGNLEKSRPVFSLSQRESSGLKKVLKLMNSNANIAFKEAKRYKSSVSGKIYSFKIWNKKIYERLLQLGLRPDKSYTMSFPDIPIKFLNHFIRGCFDGDGLFYQNRFDGSVIAKYSSSSLNFISSIAKILEKELNITININKKNKSYFFLLRKNSMKRLVEYLYKNATSDMYFSEKYQKIMKLLAI